MANNHQIVSETPIISRLEGGLHAFSRSDGWLVGVTGLVVLAGWMFENETLKRVIPGLVAMNPVTALAFICGGASLICFWQSSKRNCSKRRCCGRGLAVFLIAVGSLKTIAYVFQWDLGFDQVLFNNQILEDAGIPNEIAPNTAVNFILCGSALYFLNNSKGTFSRWAQNLSLALGSLSLIPLLGYAYKAEFFYSVGSYVPMALHTAGLFYLLANGVLLAQKESGVVILLTSQTPGGAIARYMLPFALLVPAVFGALALWGANAGLYPSAFGFSIVVVGSYLIFTVLIWSAAVRLNRSDEKRRRAEEDLQAAHARLELRVAERTADLNSLNQALHDQIEELQRAQAKISEQAELLDKAQDAIIVLGFSGRISFWNQGAERVYGWTADEAIGTDVGKLLFQDGSAQAKIYASCHTTGQWKGELQQATKSGGQVTVESRWALVKDASGNPKSVLIIGTDITEKKQYEMQLLRSQRVDSIGALASGIAHDLNNALTPVMIGVELLQQVEQDGKKRALLDTMFASARRGTDMVKQILSFARGSAGQYRELRPHPLMNEIAKIVRSTFPHSITVELKSDAQVWPVKGDVTELHQVLLNLCVNARDAMASGGTLTLSAENVLLENSVPAVETIPPGSYVVLKVGDTGSGIPQECLPKIFQPFFSTKQPGKGTGLGLSMVSNIVKNHEGFIQVQSAVGQGTEFRIYLPAQNQRHLGKSEGEDSSRPHGRGELVLVIEDESAARELVATVLENSGYRVVTARHGLQGVTAFAEHADEIKVVLTDTDMPVLDGLSAVRSIREINPDVKVILASGAKPDSEHLEQSDPNNLIRLAKPYSIEQLLNTMSVVLKPK